MFEYDKNAMKLAMAASGAIYKNEKLFYTPGVDDISIKRLELSMPSFNKILSNHHYGERAGFALGKIYNVYGPESTGKTSFALYISGEMIKAGGRVLWMDAERSFDPEYAKWFGIDVDNQDQFMLGEPDYGEQAFDVMYQFTEAKAVSLIVVDSVSALGTMRLQEKNANENSQMASLSNRLAEHFQKIIKLSADSECAVIYINQLRENITQAGAYGKKFTGGNAMKFYPHVGLELKKIKEVENSKGEFTANIISVEGDKNKTARPHIKNNFYVIPGKGFSVSADILKLAIEHGICLNTGSHFYYEEKHLGNSLPNTIDMLDENPSVLAEIDAKLRIALSDDQPIKETPQEEVQPEVKTIKLKPRSKKGEAA